MNLKKTVAIAVAAGALAAISVPAMALENEFHGMYRAYAYMTNAIYGIPISGAPSATSVDTEKGFHLGTDNRTDKFIEQRARLQYIAKASDDLKLVTHFELDTKFGGAQTSSKYTQLDAGGLDADKVTLETKSVYLDFNCPITGTNVKVGIQPFNDSFGGLFGNFDGTGVVLSKKFSGLTATYGYFTVGNDGINGTLSTTSTGAPLFDTNRQTQDLNVLDFKYAINKDLTVGASYYMVLDKLNTPYVAGVSNGYSANFGTGAGPTVTNNTVGLNANAKFGPAELAAVLGFQFGKSLGTAVNATLDNSLTASKTAAVAGAVSAKVAVGPGKVNVAALYLQGDKAHATEPGFSKFGFSNRAWQPIGNLVTYYTPANMWLITRNAATINSSAAIGGGSDLTRGGLGLRAAFAGYEGAMDKTFYSANVGYAMVDQKRAALGSSIGTEVNATVGYKLYANLSASATAAYAILGTGYNKTNAPLLNGVNHTERYENPFLTNLALNYTF